MRYRVFSLLVLLVVVSCGQSDEDLNAALQRGDYVAALPLAIKRAQAGSIFAESNLGFMYLTGQGIPKDYDQANKWLSLAAAAGDSKAQNNLGIMYLTGLGVASDPKMAADWFRKSAAQGNASAEVALGGLYYDGVGVEKDSLSAREWYLKAARAGSSRGAFQLGALYEQQIEGRINDPRMVDLYKEIADEQGLANLLATREGKPVEINGMAGKPIEVEGHIVSPDSGFIVKRVSKAALPWYRAAAEQGWTPAQLNLGDLYLRGEGTTADSSEATKWFQLAATKADKADSTGRLALLNLGVMYRYGWGVKQDEAKATEFYRKAQTLGVADDVGFKEVFLKITPRLFDSDCGDPCAGTFSVGPGQMTWFRPQKG